MYLIMFTSFIFTGNVTQSYASECSIDNVVGIRYAWRRSPCPFKKCAIYGAKNGLPMPPFTYHGKAFNKKLIGKDKYVVKLGNCCAATNKHFLTLNLLNLSNGIIHLPILKLSIIIFRDIRMRTFKLVNQQFRAWSDCTNVQAGLALYWW